MHLNSTFLHSAITYRREVLTKVKGYSDKFKAGGEDYDFVFRVLKQFKVANYPESLVNITVTNNGLSSQKRFSQVLNRLKILMKNFYIHTMGCKSNQFESSIIVENLTTKGFNQVKNIEEA